MKPGIVSEIALATFGLAGVTIEKAAVIKSGINAGKPWQRTDLFFLMAALARGMSSVQVAGFLGRDESEVEEKATNIEITRRGGIS